MTLRWDRCGDAGDPLSWKTRLTGGRELRWREFFTGPLVLDAGDLENAANRLLGVGADAVSGCAVRELESYVAGPGEPPPSMLMHSATQTTKGFDADLADLVQGRPAHDVATYLEARVVSLGRPGDIGVGRTRPWREAVTRAGLAHIDIADVEHYYLSHALLVTALRHQEAADPAIAAMADWLRVHPDAVVRLYALDAEMQIFLTWLKRQAGLNVLRVDANSPEVSATWNQKTHIHPTPGAALEIGGADELDPMALLTQEQRQAAGYQRLGMTVPVLPGYLVRRAEDTAQFAGELLAAAGLLRQRYEIRYGCFKPCEAGDGARIVPHVDLGDHEALTRYAKDAHRHGDHYLLEAHVEYLRFGVGSRSFEFAPSGHVRGGHVAEGLTVQLMNGCSWAGNALFDEQVLGPLGVSQTQYAQMMDAMHAVRDAFYGERSMAAGCYQGLVTGGVDFAIGRLGGRFGDRVVIGATDFNLSSHGAEYMRAFQDEMRAERSRAYVATRVYRPTAQATLEATQRLVCRRGGERSRTICCVPGRWAMVACAGEDTLDAVGAAFGLVSSLTQAGLADPGVLWSQPTVACLSAAAAADSAAKSGMASAAGSGMSSGCHCTATANQSLTGSIASMVPSSACAVARRSRPRTRTA